MDHGHRATSATLKLFRLMLTPTFGDRTKILCVPERTAFFEHVWMNRRSMYHVIMGCLRSIVQPYTCAKVAQKSFVPAWVCHEKNGPPRKGSPGSKYFEVFGPPGPNTSEMC